MHILSVARLAIGCTAMLVTARLLTEVPVDQVVSEQFYTNLTKDEDCEKMDSGHLEDGFYNPTDCFTRADIQQIILGLVFTIADVFERNNVSYWLDSGTLLGSYREQNVIPYDLDADIGIDEATYIRLRDNNELLEFPSVYEFHMFEAKFRNHGHRDAAIPVRLVHTKSGLYIDIFVFLESKTPAIDPEPMFGPLPSLCFVGCARCPRVNGAITEFKIPKNWVFPLKPCVFSGRNVSCPAQPEKYLGHLYGLNYMTPIRFH
ncbi:hypothetical protein FI667_g15921, partial [Globisporangium splendens]